ncbi:fimbrial protein [Aeromonas veronii]|uniref:fimbrial protein n=1 Tax=Aeromonas veronii TaxID=654 RepID=UPI003D21CC62
MYFTIRAQFVAPTCSVVTQDATQTIDMGDMTTYPLESGDSYHKPFTIRLEKCGGSSNNTVTAKLKFASTNPASGGWFYPNDGAIRGFVLGFTENGVGKKLIPLGQEVTKKMSTTTTDNKFEFGVMVRRNGSAALVTGDFQAAATATIIYE